MTLTRVEVSSAAPGPQQLQKPEKTLLALKASILERKCGFEGGYNLPNGAASLSDSKCWGKLLLKSNALYRVRVPP